MKSKSIGTFYSIVKLLMVISAIWLNIREEIATFIEENYDKIDERILETMAFFGELMDNILLELKSYALENKIS
ncbi:MAG: hypothetical protein ACTSX9_03715 [Candidatus Njordarchaeales archaeon]